MNQIGLLPAIFREKDQRVLLRSYGTNVATAIMIMASHLLFITVSLVIGFF